MIVRCRTAASPPWLLRPSSDSAWPPDVEVGLKLAESEFDRRATPVLRQVFASLDPFGTPFSEHVTERAVLYPIDATLENEEDYLGALGSAADAVEDPDIFVTSTELTYPSGRGYETWFVPKLLRDSLRTLPLPALETAYYGSRGTWGLLVSHEFHAVVGGSKDFVDGFFSQLTRTEAQMQHDLVQEWQRNRVRFGSDTEWLETLFVHVRAM